MHKKSLYNNPKLFLLFLVSLILFFSFLTYWRFREFKKSLSKIEPPKFEMPKLQTPFSPAKTEEKEFVSPDGKLKIKYSSDWLKMEEKSLEMFSKQMVIKEVKTLFFAQKIKGVALGFLSVQEIELKEDKKPEDIIEEMKKGRKEEELKISNLKLAENEAVFEVDYQKEGSPGLHSKEKILKEANKAYIISVTSFSQSWTDFEQEANQILNSTQILE